VKVGFGRVELPLTNEWVIGLRYFVLLFGESQTVFARFLHHNNKQPQSKQNRDDQ